MLNKHTILTALILPFAAIAAVPDVDVYGKIVEVKPARTENGFRFPAERARMVNVKGKEMTLMEFYKTYCLGESEKKCKKARQIILIDTGSGPKELPRSD